MASSDILQSIFNPSYQADQATIDRQSAMAQALMQQGMTPQQGQMVSGHYISPGLGGIDRIGQVLASNSMFDKAQAGRNQLGQRYAASLQGAFGQNTPQAQPDQSQQQPMQQNMPVDAQSIQNAPPGQLGNALAAQINPQPAQPPVQPAPQATPQSQGGVSQGGLGGVMTLPGMTPQQSMMLYAMDPNAYMTARLKYSEPTDATKMAMAAGQDPRQANSAMLQKNTSMTIPAGGTVRLADGTTIYGANLADGVYYGKDANGNPVAHPIDNAAQIKAATAGMVAGATKGAELPFQPPTKVDLPSGPVLMTPAQQIYAANHGGLRLQAPQQQAVENAKAEASIGAAKMQAAADPLLQVIQQARDINNKVPYGGLGLAEGKATLSSLPGMNHDDAKNAALWEQMTGQSILNTITNLASAGGIRMDIPIVKEIQKAGGIPMNLPPSARSAMLDQLESEVKSRLAAAKNTTPNLNQTNLGTTQIEPMVNTPPQSSGLPANVQSLLDKYK